MVHSNIQPESPWSELVDEALKLFEDFRYLLEDVTLSAPLLLSDGSEGRPRGDWSGILFLGDGPFLWHPLVPNIWLRNPNSRTVAVGLFGLTMGMYPLENFQPPKNSEGVRIPTPREQEVLDLAAQGLATKQIADVLGLSIPTVKFHLSNLMTKFGAQNRAELVILAAREGFLEV